MKDLKKIENRKERREKRKEKIEKSGVKTLNNQFSVVNNQSHLYNQGWFFRRPQSVYFLIFSYFKASGGSNLIIKCYGLTSII